MKLKLLVATVALLALSFGLAQAQGDYSLTLDHVDGLYNGNTSELETDVPITFHIRFTNPGEPNTANIRGSSNGFQVYSPDGATWEPITWAPYFDYGTYTWVYPFVGWPYIYNGAIKLNSFSVTGSGADTIGFAGYSDPSGTPPSNGVAPGFSQIVYTITTQLDDSQHGKTLCLDSCFYPPENTWLWSTDTGTAEPGSTGDVHPEWSGVQCYTIIDPDAPPPTSMTLSTDPDPLAFEATYGEDDPASGTLTVTSSGDAIDFTISSKPDWVTITPSSGTATEANLTVAVSNAIAGVGNHSGTIEVSSSTATNSPQTVAITFNVAAGKPTIDCPTEPVAVTGCVDQLVCFPLAISDADNVNINHPSGAYWEDVDGGQVCYTATSTSQDFIVSATNTSGTSYCNFTVNATLSDKPVIDCPAETIVLNVDELEGICYELVITDATETVITPSAGVTDLNYEENQLCFDVEAEGTYTFNIESTNGCGLTECDITFDITRNKYFIVDPESITKTGYVGGDNPTDVLIALVEVGGANIDFEAVIDQPSTEFISLNTYSATTPAILTASFDISGLTEATEYNATITFTSEEVVEPVSIPVSLTLSNIPTARLQVIHNCADLAVPTVDIWLNQERIISDFGFRTATPFFDVPAGVELAIGVSPPQGASPDPNNILYTYTIPAPGLTADESYIAVASGLYDPSGYAANPDMLPLDFKLIIKDEAREDNPGIVITTDFCLLQGVTDAPTSDYDIRGNTGDPLYDNITYGYLSNYASSLSGEWIIDVTPGDDNATILASFDFNTSSFGNRVGFLFSSGFLYPEENQNGPEMGLFMAFPDGTVHEFPKIIPKFISAEPDTIYYMASEDGTASFPQDMLIEEVNGAEIAYAASVDLESDWVTLSKESGTTPDYITVNYDIEGLDIGDHYAKIMVTSEEAENSDSVIVALTIEPLVTSDADSLFTAPPVGGPPGATEIALPVTMVNNCDLYLLMATIGWETDYLILDSVSLVGSSIGDNFSTTVVTIDGKTVTIEGAALEQEDPVMAGKHTLMTLYFTIDEMAPEGFYPVVPIQPYPKFWMECPDEGSVMVIPTLLDPELDGGVIVKRIPNYVCGYVVDPDGLPIEGASVELWADFPFDGLEMSTASDETGFFEFNDFESMPYDLWGYKEDYYPDLVEDINYTDNGIMIVLTPVDPIQESPEYVFFYCDGNTYLGAPMPIGSVIDAYNPEGIHCGTYFVTEEGKYRFLPVYRDDPTVTEKTGAWPGEEIFFYINGMLAVATGENIWDEHLAEHEVCLDAGQMITYTCELSEGWNLVSWAVDHPSDYILDALASIEGDYTLVAGFEKGGLAYDPELEEFSTLWYVDHLSGYWIKTKYPTTLVIEGIKVPSTTPIPITKGWNLVSYLPEENLAPDVALGSILDILIVAQDDEGHTFVPDGGANNYMDEMGPCQGYWLKTTDNGSLKYPGALALPSAPQVNHNRIAAKGVPADLITSNQWVNLYSRNLTLDGATIKNGTVITAYNSHGVKVGAFTMKEDGKFGFMPVYIHESANSGVIPGEEFYLAVNGTETNEKYTWTENGDRIEIFSLTSKSSSNEVLPESYGLEQNYPNPFNPTTTIAFNLPSSGKAKIEIFNVLGKLVAVPFDDIAQSGTTTVEWNGRNKAGEIVASGIYFYRLTADNYTETKKMTLLK